MWGMSKFYTVLRHCRKLGQVIGIGALCFSATLAPEAQRKVSAGRRPANYVPNDDVIAVPVNAEIGFYEKHVANDKSWSDKSAVQNQIRIWQENELMAQQYGLNTQSGAYYVPTSEEKWNWMQRSYFRYLKRKTEDPFREEPKNIWRNWTANDEVNSIDEMEARFRATSRRSVTGKALPSAFQEKSAKTKKFKLNFQPRLEQGLIIVRATSQWFDARAWVAVNGETEVNVQRTFATQTRFMMNYYVHSGEYLTAMDQNIGYGFSARVTSSWNPNDVNVNAQRNQTGQLNYITEF